MSRQKSCIKKTFVFLLLAVSLSGYTFAQKYNWETDCYKNKKKNNFIVGDTLYTNATYWKLGEGVTYDSVHSPLLDSLVVSLKKSPDIIVVLNKWFPVTKEEYANRKKKGSLKVEQLKKHMLREAKQIEYYLHRDGVTNCIICNGNGYIVYDEKKLKRADANCIGAVQIILAKWGSCHCFSLEGNKPVVLKNIYFVTDKWDVLPDSYSELDNLASYLLNHPTIKIEISGHTDNTGDYKKNIELSQKRADAVAAYLKMKFVTNSIETKGYGSSKPFRTNNSEIGRAQNRRIEVKIVK